MTDLCKFLLKNVYTLKTVFQSSSKGEAQLLARITQVKRYNEQCPRANWM